MAIIPLLAGRRARRFEQQLRPHLPALYRYAYRLCGSRDDAEDLVQELLTRLFEKQVPLDNLEHPQSWLLTVLYRQYIDTHRKSQRTPTDLNAEHSAEILDNLHQTHDTPDHALEQNRLQYDLQRAIDSLNEEQRLVVLLHDVEGFTLPQLQEVLDIPGGTLKSRLHRARARLREILSSEGEPSAPIERVNG
ncbi:MAG: RNA polymerase sigma factor [Thiohalophilus sp.]|uniref:RNA polymerase sigma factor n=1 Tax=Thiohalophilus sp. TaxID=3028392 RepID=UPI0028709753|nr:RNA polymerase sigma factor [Thiohalophilus sp.]MDR9437729.1 RNA polymerase sigma factor [Thiohalophilus sp.]